MALTYTTARAIEKRLQGWAEVFNPASSFGASQVDGSLLLQIAEQNEAKVNQVIGRRYQLPLTGIYPELASVVEKMTVCELIGQLYAGQQPSESGGYGALICQQGRAEFKMLDSIILDSEIPLGQSLFAANTSSFSGARAQPTQTVEW